MRLSAQQKRERAAAEQAAAFIASATCFVVHFRKGPAEAYREDAQTIAEARGHAARLDAAHGHYGRRAVIYAVLPSGAIEPVK